MLLEFLKVKKFAQKCDNDRKISDPAIVAFSGMRS